METKRRENLKEFHLQVENMSSEYSNFDCILNILDENLTERSCNNNIVSIYLLGSL